MCQLALIGALLPRFAGCASEGPSRQFDTPAPDAATPDPTVEQAPDAAVPKPLAMPTVATDRVPEPQPEPPPVTPLPTVSCPWGSGVIAPDGARVAWRPLEAEPERIASGGFWSFTLVSDQLYAIESASVGERSSAGASVTRYDLGSLERTVVFSEADGLVEPTAVLAHGSQLYIDDWGTRTLYQSSLEEPELQLLATKVGGARVLSRFEDSVFLSDYRGGRVVRVHDPSLEGPERAAGPLDPAKAVLELLGEVPYPSGSAAWPGHAAWGTHGHDAHLDNQLVVWPLDGEAPLALDVAGIVAAIDASEQELSWAVYGVEGSELSRAPLTDTGALDPEAIRTLRLCGQPTSTALHGTLAAYGGPGLVLWERETDSVTRLAVGLVQHVELDEAYVYWMTPEGLYRAPRP